MHSHASLGPLGDCVVRIGSNQRHSLIQGNLDVEMLLENDGRKLWQGDPQCIVQLLSDVPCELKLDQRVIHGFEVDLEIPLAYDLVQS